MNVTPFYSMAHKLSHTSFKTNCISYIQYISVQMHLMIIAFPFLIEMLLAVVGSVVSRDSLVSVPF